MPIKKMYICVMGTSKTRYIELHGEDAWELEAKRRSERYKKWRDANPEKKKQYDRDYHNANKERLNELARKNGAIYWKNNKKKLTDKQRRYRNASMVAKSYALFRNYSRDDKNRGLSVDQNIDRDWIIKNIFTSKCIYCGDDDWKHLGADRIANNKPHTPDNVVCACRLCNMERANRYSVEEFKEYRKLHPRNLGNGIEKSWEIGKENGVTVLKKKNVYL